MNITILFAVSFVGIISLLSFKWLQMRSAKAFSVSQMISRGDEYIHQKFSSVRRVLSIYKQVLVFFVTDYIPHHTYKFILSTAKMLQERSQEVIRGVKRQYALKSHASSVSSFLNHISNNQQKSVMGKE